MNADIVLRYILLFMFSVEE